ncbi:MAG: hypothetical protein UT66_C0040G0005 [candidate division CPR2 bacterium GW2011_GWC1_39_9]|nr:MAG: hypothetical protein UT66_C0040G0005 [candidate division CPR2 bacterium GW2011_GWC1_39_9]HCH59043.1 DNA-binding protein [Candidatus Zambryskibacteria bacterium]
MKKIKVGSQVVSVELSSKDNDYISLTDMLKAKDGDFFISDWLRNRNTIEFLSIWERLYNPDFNYGEFAIIKSKAGLNSFKISVKEWVQKTNSIGLKATAGRYGGTYAHKDIAYEFASWISPEFKLFLIKEFQRLKTQESEKLQLGWDVKRMLTKVNYKIHTDAIKQHIVLPQKLTQKKTQVAYANEADVLNVALFGKTAKQWRDENPDKDGNIRDHSNVTELVCLANLENLNAEFIRAGISQGERLEKLNESAISQMTSLLSNPTVKKLDL